MPKSPDITHNKKIVPRLKIAILATLCCLSVRVATAEAPSIYLTASWYSVESLKKEGTYKYSKGVMANGKIFSDNGYTCATRLYPLGTYLYVTNTRNNKTVKVKVTDRIGQRFAETRIDLSKRAFRSIANLKQGIIPCKVERIK